MGRRWAAAAAVVLGLGLSLAPPAAGPAAAASGSLLVTSAATYSVDVEAGVVHVADVVTLRNDKPSDASFDYYWRDISWFVQAEATRITARDASGGLAVTPRQRDGYIEVELRLRRNLLFGQSVTVTIAWDLPTGGPRSSSSIRVGPAFVAFELWASGDPGSSSVRAILPDGFAIQTYGSTVTTSAEGDGYAVSATAIDDPAQFWVAVTATRDSAYARTTVSPARNVELIVRGWPDDPEWRTTVAATLNRGVPELLDLTGLPWPVADALLVTEIYSPLLEGYAGLYYTEEDRIEISEELDTFVILHEISHAWFNDGLFTGRWISEGQADTYAAIALGLLGEERPVPDEPIAGDDAEIDLAAWGPPRRITEETEATELWAYNAAWFVTDALYDEIGPERMRDVFQAADQDLTAYPGADPGERVAVTDDWRRYLDLLEEIGGSATAEALFREYVVTQAAVRDLDARAAAREAYAELLDDGDGWLPPPFVRGELGAWRFASAESRITEAGEILALRDEIEAAALALELEPDDALETAYEAAFDNFVEAQDIGRAELTVLETLAETEVAIDAPLDVLGTVGLLGATPRDGYEAAAAAFEAGDLEIAETAARDALALVTDAPRVGRERLLAGVGVAIGGTAVLGLGIAIRGRRRSNAAARASAVAAAVALPPPALPPPALPSPIEPYGTLAADSPAPPPEAARTGDAEGGTADGGGSSATP
ncbi:MAG: hypothetical protein AB1736_08555 [Chloroflexota bacterium]